MTAVVGEQHEMHETDSTIFQSTANTIDEARNFNDYERLLPLL